MCHQSKALRAGGRMRPAATHFLMGFIRKASCSASVVRGAKIILNWLRRLLDLLPCAIDTACWTRGGAGCAPGCGIRAPSAEVLMRQICVSVRAIGRTGSSRRRSNRGFTSMEPRPPRENPVP